MGFAGQFGAVVRHSRALAAFVDDRKPKSGLSGVRTAWGERIAAYVALFEPLRLQSRHAGRTRARPFRGPDCGATA